MEHSNDDSRVESGTVGEGKSDQSAIQQFVLQQSEEDARFNLQNLESAAMPVVPTHPRSTPSSSSQQSPLRSNGTRNHVERSGMPMTVHSMGFMQEPQIQHGYNPHQHPHSHLIHQGQIPGSPYGMHDAHGMMHGMYDSSYGNMYDHHQYYPHRPYAAAPAEYGGGIGYGRGFMPMGGRYEGNGIGGHMTGGRGRGPRGRGGRQFNRKTVIQDKLSSNKDRTVYVSEIDHNVTEEDLARLFSDCGDVVDCRLCGDAHSRMRFAFVEFSPESGEVAIQKALKLNNCSLGSYPIRVLRSRTAIVPVKREFMPQSEDEMERCMRTIYVSNIDKRLSEDDVINFFETMCQGEGDVGRINKIRLLGDDNHSTAIAFVEFVTPESASVALAHCQGALMGCLPLRVSPSKTPVRTAEEDRQLREARKAVGEER